MIPVALAIKLRDAGLTWQPAAGDQFAIPDRDLDGETFVLSNMIAAVHDLPSGTVIGFNGTTEWALDDIDRDEAIWLPREDQLRTLLGPAFRHLRRDGDGYRVAVHGETDAVGATPEEAYGHAVLAALNRRLPGWRRALDAADPVAALRAAAEQRLAAGATREELVAELTGLLLDLRKDGQHHHGQHHHGQHHDGQHHDGQHHDGQHHDGQQDDRRHEDPILDVLDMLTGWSAPGSAL